LTAINAKPSLKLQEILVHREVERDAAEFDGFWFIRKSLLDI